MTSCSSYRQGLRCGKCFHDTDGLDLVSLIWVVQLMHRVQDVIVGRSFHHKIVGDPLYCVCGFNWLPSKLIVQLFVDDSVVLVRNNTARVSRTGTPAAATTVCSCRCRFCAYEDLLANDQAQHHLQRILRCAILVAWNCVRHTVAGALHSICRYHKKENQAGSTVCTHTCHV